MWGPVTKTGASRFTRRQKAKSPDESHRGYDADREPPVHLAWSIGRLWVPNKFPAEKFARVGARERVELAEKLASGDGDQQGAGGRVDPRGRP